MSAETRLTPELAEKLVSIIREGNYRRTACMICRVHETTFSRWMASNREPFLSFQAAVREAEAEAEREQLAKIVTSPEPADAKWYLARKNPDAWAETRRVDLKGRIDLGTKLDVSKLSSPDAQQALITLLGALDSDEGNAGTESADEGSDQ